MRSWFPFLGLLACVGCATSPTGRSQLLLFSSSQMETLGLQAFEQIRADKPISGDAGSSGYVTCVARAITDALPAGQRDAWEVVVFEDEAANAFALPARKIGVYTGLLAVAENQDQLAAVLGHEVGHVLAAHSNERASQNTAASLALSTASVAFGDGSASSQLLLGALGVGAQYGVLLPFSRSHESEADIIGLELMARAGFDPTQSAELWRNMARASAGAPPEWASTHPSAETRIEDLEAGAPAAQQLRAEANRLGRNPHCR